MKFYETNSYPLPLLRLSCHAAPGKRDSWSVRYFRRNISVRLPPLARLNKELTKAEKELGMFTNQLNNPKFVEKAPAKLVEETRAKLAAAQEKTAKIKESIAALG